MKKNKLVKISAIIAAALLISACSTNVRGPQEKIAVINWEQAVSAHPQYAKLEQGEKILQDLLNKRKGQEELAKAQLSSLNKLRSLRQLSQQSFMEADFNTRMVEQRRLKMPSSRSLWHRLRQMLTISWLHAKKMSKMPIS